MPKSPFWWDKSFSVFSWTEITYSSTPKELWDTFKIETSYKFLDGGIILLLLDKSR